MFFIKKLLTNIKYSANMEILVKERISMTKKKDAFSSHKIITVTKVVTKAAEVICWVMTAAMLVLAGWSICAPDGLLSGLDKIGVVAERPLSCLGFSIMPPVGEAWTTGMVTTFTVVSVLLLGLMAMVFRNIYLILKTADGKSWFAKSDTPFQGDIVRMLREIGIFLIVSTVISILAAVVTGIMMPEVELSSNVVSAVLGLLMLCLSQFFAYGTELEKDTKGLI